MQVICVGAFYVNKFCKQSNFRVSLFTKCGVNKVTKFFDMFTPLQALKNGTTKGIKALCKQCKQIFV